MDASQQQNKKISDGLWWTLVLHFFVCGWIHVQGKGMIWWSILGDKRWLLWEILQLTKKSMHSHLERGSLQSGFSQQPPIPLTFSSLRTCLLLVHQELLFPLSNCLFLGSTTPRFQCSFFSSPYTALVPPLKVKGFFACCPAKHDRLYGVVLTPLTRPKSQRFLKAPLWSSFLHD